MNRSMILAGTLLLTMAAQAAVADPAPPQPATQPRTQSTMPPPDMTANDKGLVQKVDPSKFVLNPVQTVKQYCCGGSMSSSRNCLDVTLSNAAGTPMTWGMIKFVGVVQGDCLKSHLDPSCANNPPGVICTKIVCEQYAADTTITTDGSALTVPAKGSAKVTLMNPAKTYKSGHVEVATKAGAPSSSTDLSTLPWLQCAN